MCSECPECPCEKYIYWQKLFWLECSGRRVHLKNIHITFLFFHFVFRVSRVSIEKINLTVKFSNSQNCWCRGHVEMIYTEKLPSSYLCPECSTKTMFNKYFKNQLISLEFSGRRVHLKNIHINFLFFYFVFRVSRVSM